MEELGAVAEELYGLRPDRFTAARTAAALRARDAGDRALQAEIRALRRPSISAWVVNLLVRERAELVEQVVSLGDSLREAQSLLQGDALRDLGSQRRRLVAAVAAEARSLAESRGQKVTDSVTRQVEETLQAAMTDRSAASAVRSGLLTQPLSSTGLAALAESLAVPDTGIRASKARRLTVVPEATGDESEAERRAAAVADAQKRADAAADRLRTALRKREKAEERRATAQAELLGLEARLEELRRQVAELEARAEDVAETLTRLDAKHDRASARVTEARAAADQAAARLAELRET